MPWSHLWLTLHFCPLVSWIAYDLYWLLCLAHLDSPTMLFHFLSLLASAPSILFNNLKFLLGDSRWLEISLESLEIRCSIWHVLSEADLGGGSIVVNPTTRTCSHSDHGWSSPSRRYGRHKLPQLCSWSWALAMNLHNCTETHYRKRSVLPSEWRS